MKLYTVSFVRIRDGSDSYEAILVSDSRENAIRDATAEFRHEQEGLSQIEDYKISAVLEYSLSKVRVLYTGRTD